MADRINYNEALSADALNSPNRRYLRESQASATPKFVDEVIAHLANARENRRARQVSEWEGSQRYSFRAAA